MEDAILWLAFLCGVALALLVVLIAGFCVVFKVIGIVERITKGIKP